MEIVDQTLLIYFTTLSVISATLPLLLKPVWPLIFRRSKEESECLVELKSLKKEQSGLSQLHNFAAHSKLQRKINVIEDKYKEISQGRLAHKMTSKLIIMYGLQALTAVITLTSVFIYSNVPIFIVDGNLTPFTWFLSYPTGIPNAISTHAWALITNSVIRTMLRWF